MVERPNSKVKLTAEKRDNDTTSTTRTPEFSSENLTESLQAFVDSVIKEQNITIPGDRHEPHPDFLPTLSHISKRLCKLVSLTTGKPHPYCPDSVLRYHLLTSAQLDDIARHYHQIRPPVPETYRYPNPIAPWIGTGEEHTIDIEKKRERIGQFIGLRMGTMAPTTTDVVKPVVAVTESQSPLGEKLQMADIDDDDDDNAEDHLEALCERIRTQMQKDWEEALERARRDEGDPGIVRLPKA